VHAGAIDLPSIYRGRPKELTTARRIGTDSRRAVGMDVTIHSPTLDPDGAGERGLASVIGDALV